MAFYYPNECGGCSRAPDFGEEFLPYLARTLVGKHRYPVDDGASTIYLCNSCKGIVDKGTTILLVEQVQYRISTTQLKRKPTYQSEAKNEAPWTADQAYDRQKAYYEYARKQMEQQVDADILHRHMSQQQAPPSRAEREAESFAAKYGYAKPPKMSDEEFRQRLLNLLYNKDK